VTYHGRTTRLRDSKGLSCIARLLAQPRCGVHVRDLADWHRRSNAPDGSGDLPVEGDLGAEYSRTCESWDDRRRLLWTIKALGRIGYITYAGGPLRLRSRDRPLTRTRPRRRGRGSSPTLREYGALYRARRSVLW
jgi:hypothetical protein